MTADCNLGIAVGDSFCKADAAGGEWRVVRITRPRLAPPHAYISRRGDPTTVTMIAISELLNPHRWEKVEWDPLPRTG